MRKHFERGSGGDGHYGSGGGDDCFGGGGGSCSANSVSLLDPDALAMPFPLTGSSSMDEYHPIELRGGGRWRQHWGDE